MCVVDCVCEVAQCGAFDECCKSESRGVSRDERRETMASVRNFDLYAVKVRRSEKGSKY
jgi:hypothetical protein